MKVYIPSPLRSYTGQKNEVNATGSTLKEVISDLDRRYPGFRFRIINEQERIREHIRIFVNQEQAQHLNISLQSNDQIQILCALSGG